MGGGAPGTFRPRRAAKDKKDVSADSSSSELKNILYTNLQKCPNCRVNLAVVPGSGRTASVWNGACWRQVDHGQKRCWQCRIRFYLNFKAANGEKPNILKKCEDSDVVLVNPFVGFDYAYL